MFVVALLCLTVAFSCFGCALLPDNQPDNNPQDNTPTTDNPSNNNPTDNKPTTNEPSTETPSENEPTPVTPPAEVEKPAWAKNFNLPDGDEALQKLIELYGGKEKVFLLQNGKIARMPCPQGEAITLNMTYEVGEYTKLVLEDSIAEFNDVFSVINPNYKFAINYNPTEDDFKAKYSVKMSASDNLKVTETSQVFGLAHVSYYANFTELGDFGITIKTEVLNNGSYLLTTFKHELMHLLGAGDAYNNSNATKDTVMQSYTVNGYHNFSKTDVAFLDTLYRNPEFNANENEINSFIDSYEETTQHTRFNVTSAVYQKLVSNINPETLIEQAEAIGYKDLTDFTKTVKKGVTINADFGKTSVSFKEIEYAETQSETYFGSIDTETKRYAHGRQTASMGSSGAFYYTDYGNGVIYAAPNGSLYTILIQTGEYVLTFHFNGSFKNLSALSLDLWHISKI